MGTSFRKTAISNGISLMYSLSWMEHQIQTALEQCLQLGSVVVHRWRPAVSGRVSQRPIYAIWYIRHLLSSILQ